MKKDGLLAGIIQAVIKEEKKRVAEKQPDIVFNQKKQLWYLMMNQIDGSSSENEEETLADHKK